MNHHEIKAIIIEKMTAALGTYDSVHPEVNKNFAANFARDPVAYRLGPTDWSHIFCDASPDMLEFVLTHPEFSHFRQRDRYSVTVYWHDDGSPTRVSSVASFDPKRLQEAYKLIGDEIGAATAWANGNDE